MPVLKEDWKNLPAEEKKRIQREGSNRYAKLHRDRLKAMSPEELAEYKSNKQYDKEKRAQDKLDKQRAKELKLFIERENKVLQFMLHTDILYFHHSTQDSLLKEVKEQIMELKEPNASYLIYHPYIWNYQGEGNNYMSRALLGHLWRSSEFETIYDVPLDGSYYFYCYDSGERGCGAFHRMTCAKNGEGPLFKDGLIPRVNPGGMPPITAR